MSKKTARLRFYASLNDFLSAEDRQQAVDYSFWGTPSIKDAIEALGVPHTEVSLILVNSQPVAFNHNLQAGNFISVYPAFQSLDMSHVSLIPERFYLQFILDTHLGKLARYLRMLGFDTLYSRSFTDTEIIRLSLQEHRIILTRDLGILKQRIVRHGYYIRSEDPKEQIKEVFLQYNLKENIQPFSRCINCNGKLRKIEKENISEELEIGTRKYFEEFYRCTNCKKIYWKGSHYERMQNMINELANSIIQNPKMIRNSR